MQCLISAEVLLLFADKKKILKILNLFAFVFVSAFSHLVYLTYIAY